MRKSIPDRELLEGFSKVFPDLEPSSVEAFLLLLKTASGIFEYMGEHFQRVGLSQGRFVVLITLRISPSTGFTPAELAEHIGVSRATITGLVDGLEVDGYVERRRHEKDGRKFQIKLTERGESFLSKFLPKHFRRIAGLMEALQEEEKCKLIDLLGKLQKGLKQGMAETGADQ